MKTDIRSDAAQFYDLNPDFPQDVPFYLGLIPSANSTMLELGCGTGRITTVLARHCGFIEGIDISSAMIELCRTKLAKLGIPQYKVRVSVGDISDFSFPGKFDLIIAPFRVLQNLESDSEVDGLLECIQNHLAPGGTCILNVFKPLYSREQLKEKWLIPGEHLNWEIPVEGGKVTCCDRRTRIDKERLIIYPDLIYRRYLGSKLETETILHLVMRCYYPEMFQKLIMDHGFEIIARWGGYKGEQYGDGPELILQFCSSS
jgi:SAM-dependent methyltransferase